jgi:hypothetical protein
VCDGALMPVSSRSTARPGSKASSAGLTPNRPGERWPAAGDFGSAEIGAALGQAKMIWPDEDGPGLLSRGYHCRPTPGIQTLAQTRIKERWPSQDDACRPSRGAGGAQQPSRKWSDRPSRGSAPRRPSRETLRQPSRGLMGRRPSRDWRGDGSPAGI